MKTGLLVLSLLVCGACATARTPEPNLSPALPAVAPIDIPADVAQGGLLLGSVPPDSRLSYDGQPVRVAANGRFVVGVARERIEPVVLRIVAPDGQEQTRTIAIVDREFPLERIEGVPPKTVDPPPEIAARIEREQAAVNAARTRDDDRTDFDVPFIWPVSGRVSGVFGSQRVYNGMPKSPHAGLDIAAPQGVAVQAPAGGLVTFAAPDLYLTGGTVLIDHGHGVSSNFLHLSRIEVEVGERIEQGQIIGRVGATGRATGPHLHWGMNWFAVRVDPRLLLEKQNP